jgi:hypothetical protein
MKKTERLNMYSHKWRISSLHRSKVELIFDLLRPPTLSLFHPERHPSQHPTQNHKKFFAYDDDDDKDQPIGGLMVEVPVTAQLEVA